MGLAACLVNQLVPLQEFLPKIQVKYIF